LPEMEKAPWLLASPPQVCPSEAVPQWDWLARWNVSVARVVPELGVDVAVGVGVFVGVGVGVTEEEPWIATANLFENSSSNQMRFWESTLSPS